MNSLGHAPEFAAIAKQYGPLVYRAAYRLLGDHAMAQDVQQDVFLRLLQRPPPGVDSWPAYLTSAAVRVAIDQLRRKRRWRAFAQFWRSGPESSVASAEQSALADERVEQLRHALSLLKPLEAECFAMRYLHRFDMPQISASLGITQNHVSVCLHRAIKRLQAQQTGGPDALQEI